ncbi:MAG: hypothetical protein H6760_05215 [Candidatus Nomurabacteria bacterium]|nr:MAG: hypothetical protein H6760_05215 [Candidatus Nomurabacteria bacterium]
MTAKTGKPTRARKPKRVPLTLSLHDGRRLNYMVGPEGDEEMTVFSDGQVVGDMHRLATHLRADATSVTTDTAANATWLEKRGIKTHFNGRWKGVAASR